MPEVLLDGGVLFGTRKWAVVDRALEAKGIYLPVYCPVRQELVALVFHKTERTDRRGRPVLQLVAIQPLEEMERAAEDQLAEMPVSGEPS
jgi:hypothetical protein